MFRTIGFLLVGLPLVVVALAADGRRGGVGPRQGLLGIRLGYARRQQAQRCGASGAGICGCGACAMFSKRAVAGDDSFFKIRVAAQTASPRKTALQVDSLALERWPDLPT